MTEVSVGVMTERERGLADGIYQAIMHASRYSERALQADRYQAGISDLGYCSERLRRMLGQETPDDIDLLPAFIGTAIGDHVEQAIGKAWPDARIQAEVTVPLYGDGGVYHVTGHPDVLLPWGVLDGKTARGLGIARRNGPNQQQQFQRHCYAKGAWLAGYFGDLPIEDVTVGNFWIDRAADEREVHVQLEPYDEQVVQAATWWLDEVVYAYVNNQQARKEPAREVCAATCGFFGTCRALDTDVEGLLSDDDHLTAVDMYREGLDLVRAGERLKDQAKSALHGINGSTGEWAVRWVHVNGGEVNYVRNPYDKLDIRKIK